MCVALLIIASIASIAPVVGGFAYIFTIGYFGAIFYQFVNTTATGSTSAPKFPTTTNVMQDLILPIAQVIFVIVISFAPYFLYIYIAGSEDSKAIISLPLLALGIIYSPMAMLSLIVLGFMGAVSPTIVLPAILKGGWMYWLSLLVIILLSTLVFVMELLMHEKIFLGPVLMAFINSYALMTIARALGLVYHKRADELNWI